MCLNWLQVLWYLKLATSYIRDRPCEFVGQNGQRFALAVFFLYVGQILLTRRIVAEAQDRRCRESPFEVRLANLRAGGALALPCRFLGALDQAAIGPKILDAGEAGDIMHLIQQRRTRHWSGRPTA